MMLMSFWGSVRVLEFNLPYRLLRRRYFFQRQITVIFLVSFFLQIWLGWHRNKHHFELVIVSRKKLFRLKKDWRGAFIWLLVRSLINGVVFQSFWRQRTVLNRRIRNSPILLFHEIQILPRHFYFQILIPIKVVTLLPPWPELQIFTFDLFFIFR